MPDNRTVNYLPLVSIVITSYNRANLIHKAIESALAQDYSNLEIIISDNCSDDNTDEVVGNYQKDPRIKYSKNSTNVGMMANFKKATYELAKGEYVTYISSDDYLTDNQFVSKSVELVNKYENVVLIFGRLRQLIGKERTVIETDEKPFWLQEFWQGKEVFYKYVENSWLSWGGCFLRLDKLKEINAFTNLKNTASDIELNLKIMLLGNVAFINNVVYEQIIHFQNESTSTDANKKMDFIEYGYEVVYEFARNILPNEKEKLKIWRHQVIEIYIKQYLITLKIANRSQFTVFLNLVKEKYPEIYRNINKDFRWKVMNNFYHPMMFPLLKIASPKRYEYFKQMQNS